MTGSGTNPENHILNVLLFSLGGVSFGVDSEQIASIEAKANVSDSDDIVWAHDILGFGMIPVSYSSPTVLTIKSGSASPSRVIIDSMEDISEFQWSSIRPFPQILENHLLKRGIWGILHKDNNLVLLIDFHCLTY